MAHVRIEWLLVEPETNRVRRIVGVSEQDVSQATEITPDTSAWQPTAQPRWQLCARMAKLDANMYCRFGATGETAASAYNSMMFLGDVGTNHGTGSIETILMICEPNEVLHITPV